MDIHDVFIFPCVDCNTIIAITLDMGPAAFRCPVCNIIYVVDPIEQSPLRVPSLDFSAMDLSGHRIEVYSGRRAEAIRRDKVEATRFYTNKVGGLSNVYVAALHSSPRQGWS